MFHYYLPENDDFQTGPCKMLHLKKKILTFNCSHVIYFICEINTNQTAKTLNVRWNLSVLK